MSVVGCVMKSTSTCGRLAGSGTTTRELASWSFLPHSTYKHRVTQLSHRTSYSWVTGDRGVNCRLPGLLSQPCHETRVAATCQRALPSNGLCSARPRWTYLYRPGWRARPSSHPTLIRTWYCSPHTRPQCPPRHSGDGFKRRCSR